MYAYFKKFYYIHICIFCFKFFFTYSTMPDLGIRGLFKKVKYTYIYMYIL